MSAHLEDEHGDGERERDPEAARHVDEFVVGALLHLGGVFRLERHAADRT